MPDHSFSWCATCGVLFENPGERFNTCPRHRDSMAKIRLKGGPKRYKRGPGPTKRDRLEVRLRSLVLAAAKLNQRPDVSFADRAWASTVVDACQALLGLPADEDHK